MMTDIAGTILLATTRFPPEIRCGVERVAEGLSAALAQNGHRVVVVTSGDESEVASTPEGVVVLRHKALFRRDGFWWMLRSSLRFLHGRRVWSCRPERPMGIICNSPQYVPWAKMMFPNTPVLFICHGTSAVDRMLGGVPATRPGLRTRLMLKFTNGVKTGQERLANLMCDRLVVLTGGMRDEVARYNHLLASKLAVIPNGVDYERFGKARNTRTDLNLPLKICFVGRLSGLKNVKYLVSGLVSMAAEPSWICRIVGDGPEKANLDGLVRQFGLEDRVLLEGWCTDPRDVYDWADVFVLPSKLEGLSIALLEAMASGLACVALKPKAGRVVADYSGIIEPGLNGVLTDGDDPRSLGRVLTELVRDRGLCRAMGAMSRTLAETRYSWRTIAKQYTDLLAGIHGMKNQCMYNDASFGGMNKGDYQRANAEVKEQCPNGLESSQGESDD